MKLSYKEMQAQAEAEKEKQKAITLAKIAKANDVFFARECADAGIDPARGVSPSLLKLLGQNP